MTTDKMAAVLLTCKGDEILIRPAMPEDADGIAYVQAHTWKTTYSGLMPEAILDARIELIPERADSVRQRIVAGEDFFVAECGDRIVGMAVCKASRNLDYPLDGEIQAIYILKEYQGRRIGKELFLHCTAFLKQGGYSNMIVNCLEGNPSALFYQKMGGIAVGKRQDPLGEGLVIRETIFRFRL